MILTKNYKAIINDKFDFYESIIDEINFINCSDLEIKVFYAFEPYKDRTLKIIFKDCEEYIINNKAVVKNKKEFKIVTVHQEIEGFTINNNNGLTVEIATNFEKNYIKLKCSEIWVETIE
ncbi:MAG: hypothetical protein PHY08_13905 [Candidatus Cloacimonetes bacterium]|nr:hypothetical protein [Candidatus Cloacimonadota bacterium]